MNKTKEALYWITELLKKYTISYQITGGLAAIAYGSTRKIADIDIDIPEDKFELLIPDVKKFITFGPDNLKGEKWDLLLMTLNYKGQEIDLSGAYCTKVCNVSTGKWQIINEELTIATVMDVLGLQLPVIPYEKLIAYKKALSREVDLMDIREMESKATTMKNKRLDHH